MTSSPDPILVRSAPPLTLSLIATTSLGGACGALLRALLTHAFPDAQGFPATTLLINVVGAGLLALLPAVAAIRSRRWLALAAGPGLLGGFTTMSAHAVQTVQLARPDTVVTITQAAVALTWVVVTLLAALAAVAVVSHLVRPADQEEFASEDGDA